MRENSWSDVCCRFAPEAVEFSVFTHASDCWMYAVVLWELFSHGADPWAFETPQQVHTLFRPPCISAGSESFELQYSTIQYKTCNVPYVTRMLFVGARMTRD